MHQLPSARPVGLEGHRLRVTCSSRFSCINSLSCLEPTSMASFSVGRLQLDTTLDLVLLLELAFPQLFAQSWWLVKNTVQRESICKSVVNTNLSGFQNTRLSHLFILFTPSDGVCFCSSCYLSKLCFKYIQTDESLLQTKVRHFAQTNY